MKKKIYIASPFGFSEAGRDYMYGTVLPIVLEQGFEILDPWKLTPAHLIQEVNSMPYGIEKKNKWKELNQVIASHNTEALRACDGLFAILDGVDVDSGTASEIGFVAALGKPVVGYRGDFRLSADNEGSTVNLQVQYFIEMHGGHLITELSGLGESLNTVFGT
ncbi:nucleoside 2-deoxyribosyltransferase [Reichenbachiella ulvae]|uniref:Nucleoside 2-deoxyribosyltransferase n=1 Tax=Reichenbachiella ulvae TaxID=2980104 RepID=A0ABT3CWD6_9BACT|nr:nucleoside 2-deoxyribosyltransferase [Reichenbachiella ulvae]MCV9387863.1 nucleoside 2-deoxyribosyltransferase [Reichenbachiella ulvae]